jgi:sugar-specific transcriptional regulator TrmB
VKLRSGKQMGREVMEIITEDIETLTWLGLTERQARVYLALLQIGSSGAEAISRFSSVHRQEVYRVAARLQEMGLVETTLTSPTLFSAVPVENALEVMVNQKNKEFDEVRLRTKRIIKKFNQTDLQLLKPADKPYFTVVSGTDCFRKMQNAIDGSRVSINLLVTFKRFCQSFSIQEDLIKRALENHVRLQVVTERPTPGSIPKWVVKALLEKPERFELRTLSGNVKTTVVIYDNVRICIAIDVLSDIARGSQLWSNCESLVALSSEYFKNKWIQSERFSLKHYV